MTRWPFDAEPTETGTAVITSAASYAATSADRAVFVNTTGGNRTVTLPAANAAGTASVQFLLVARTETDSGNSLSVVAAGSDQIRNSGILAGTVAVVSEFFCSDGVSVWEQL